MNIRATISKEEVSEIGAMAEFPGEIVLVDDLSQVPEALAYLEQFSIVGFDTETKPCFTRGVQNEVALVQIATLERAYLFRVCQIDFPPQLKAFIANPNILKIGLSLRDDYRAMRRRAMVDPAGFVELQKLCPAYGIEEQGLRKIYAILFGERMSKQAQLTNWEAPHLPDRALAYAALDAYACLRIYNLLMTLPTPAPHLFAPV